MLSCGMLFSNKGKKGDKLSQNVLKGAEGGQKGPKEPISVHKGQTYDKLDQQGPEEIKMGQ